MNHENCCSMTGDKLNAQNCSSQLECRTRHFCTSSYRNLYHVISYVKLGTFRFEYENDYEIFPLEICNNRLIVVPSPLPLAQHICKTTVEPKRRRLTSNGQPRSCTLGQI